MLLIQCMWVTSLRYEGRYESDDLFHLAIKGTHVLMLVGVGACSDQFTIEGSFWRAEKPRWDPTAPHDDVKLENPRSKEHFRLALTPDYSHWAFRKVVYIFIAHQALFAAQYVLGKPLRTTKVADESRFANNS